MTMEILGAVSLVFSSLTFGAGVERAVEPVVLTRADQPITLEQYVREYFVATPILAEVAKCESRFRHFGKHGVLRGDVDPRDVGVMQINERYHGERAEKNGFDIATLDGNLGYAAWLYEREGLQPWKPSRGCWKYAEALAFTANTQ